MPSDDSLSQDARSPLRPELIPAPSVSAAGEPEGRRSRFIPAGRRYRFVGVVAVLTLCGAAVLAIPSATAEPKPTVTQVEKAVKRLQAEAEQASENYDTTRETLKSIKVRMRAAKVQLGQQQILVAQERKEVGMLAAETYRQGQLSTLNIVLSDDPQAALAQAGFLPSLGQRQAEVLQRLKQGQQDLVDSQNTMKQQQLKAELAQTKMKANRATILKRLAQVQAELNKLQGNQLLAYRRNLSRSESANLPPGANSLSYCDARASEAPSGAARTALHFACAQLGDPYLWAATGPDRYDCSGLTMRSYGAAGVSLPHSSRLQATFGTPVSDSALEPGDLVFFHSPISHVGIYLGEGLMIHAPQSGDVVRVASMYSTPVAAVRLG